MARVRINNGPTVETEGRAPSISERIKADANRIEYETDITGRRIGVCKLDFLSLHEITCAVGDIANNSAAFNQILAVASVAEIAGDPVAVPTSHLEVKALMKRLDFHGLDAAIKAVGRLGVPGGDIDAIKNS
jgi:hypothetical protein